jgi:N-hydroxyarylamine O-acetyltransferase
MKPEVSISAKDRDRYLRLLGVRLREPDFELLAELTVAHLTHVPFENVSKLYLNRQLGLRGVPSLARYLDGIEHNRLGGTCYAINSHFNLLLRSLGFDAILCGADMARPDVHVANIVRLDGREYVVDAGYGAPFLAPLPRDLDSNYEIALGDERYILKPRDAEGRSRLEQFRGGKPVHGYLLKPASRRIEEFERVIEDSFAAAATFMNALAIVRFSAGRSLVLHNLKLIESEGTTVHVRRIDSLSELPESVEKYFGIPGSITREALNGRSLSQDPWE